MSKLSRNLNATNVANYHHFHCNLYLHYLHHGVQTDPSLTTKKPSELSKAQFERGLDWEAALYKWLDDQELLLTIESGVLDAPALQEMISCDERDHFFITGLQVWPPNEAFAERFVNEGHEPVKFGLAKPDLLEIWKTDNGTVGWRILDAKSSKEMKVCNFLNNLRFL